MRTLRGQEARGAMLASLVPLRRALQGTLGPGGGACLLSGRPVRSLRTGVEIARHLPAGPGDAALRIVREVLVEAERDIGDGTARIGLAVEAMVRQADLLSRTGRDGAATGQALGATVERFCERLAREGGREPDLVAMGVSAGADSALANELADLARAVGPGGRIELREGEGGATETRLASSFTMEALPVAASLPVATLHNPFVLVANEEIADIAHLLPLLEAFATRGKSLAILARDVRGAALQTLHANRKGLSSSIAVLKPASVAEEAAQTLLDAATALGATLVCNREGTSLERIRPSMLGSSSRIEMRGLIAAFETPGGQESERRARAAALRAEAGRQRFLSLDRERLERRAARLEGRFAELHLARRDRLAAHRLTFGPRAAAAMLSAMRHGSVIGGAVGLARIANPAEQGEEDSHRCLSAALRAWAPDGHDGERLPADPSAALGLLAARTPDPAIEDAVDTVAAALRRATSTASALMTGEILCIA